MVKRTSKTIDHPDQLDLLASIDGAPELMDVPEIPTEEPGALDYDQRMRAALKQAITESGLGREKIAEAVTELCGRKVTKSILDTFTGQG